MMQPFLKKSTEVDKMNDEFIKIERLTKMTNFPLWKDKVITYAKAGEFLRILLGTYDEPEEQEAKYKLAVLEARVKSFLFSILDEEHHKAVLHKRQRSLGDHLQPQGINNQLLNPPTQNRTA
jgi:hypothetical protein